MWLHISLTHHNIRSKRTQWKRANVSKQNRMKWNKNKTGNVCFDFHYTIFLSACYDDHRLNNYRSNFAFLSQTYTRLYNALHSFMQVCHHKQKNVNTKLKLSLFFVFTLNLENSVASYESLMYYLCHLRSAFPRPPCATFDMCAPDGVGGVDLLIRSPKLKNSDVIFRRLKKKLSVSL